ncbi:ubiquitin carboxyl-terminal hydrolase isozyme L5 [Metopolophium dirhodum]|uniref:ubiquitin carboxyl-terminal hydrolase isozyme L5 n=1 Tax=Metopolophium dirhodum TaxID=44670 RepID=UPI00298FAE42|nr:ubiquitin carboxyl-terminal hydrolase isozyme L5 [Metopolophium dirhodum]XP_060863371.1 ubiquitin carboxyl-terminal hydrolase isozyme L5 [Metopolophium dirhodum]
MSDSVGWCLIESDPGVFTELIRELGVTGAQVEELWTLDSSLFDAIKPVHGLIFLFRWIGEDQPDGPIVRDSRIEKLFFAKQVINNACATQAILSVLFNCHHPDIELGTTLSEFKEFSQKFDANMKGLALSNSQKIRSVHNSFGRSNSIFEFDDTAKPKSKDDEAYHFVAIVPIEGRLYELDGLKEGPIDLGLIKPNTDWVEAAKPFIEKRINKYKEGEVHFNLMAVVSDRKLILEQRLLSLKTEELDEATKISEESNIRMKIADEEDKMKRYKIENARRKHNYLPLIVEILKLLAKDGKLVPLYERAKAKTLEKEKQKIGKV